MADALMLPDGRVVRRVQRTRRKGQPGMPEGAVYVGRPTRWGNPFFRIGRVSDAEAATVYEAALTCSDQSKCRGLHLLWPDYPHPKPTIGQIRAALAGRDLACWCKPGAPCHGDVLLRLANPDGVPVTEGGGRRG